MSQDDERPWIHGINRPAGYAEWTDFSDSDSEEDDEQWFRKAVGKHFGEGKVTEVRDTEIGSQTVRLQNEMVEAGSQDCPTIRYQEKPQKIISGLGYNVAHGLGMHRHPIPQAKYGGQWRDESLTKQGDIVVPMYLSQPERHEWAREVMGDELGE